MIPPWLFILALLTAVGSGVIAGVFYAFSTFVMKALGRVAPAEGARAMQQINVVVLNPMFLGVFMGTAATGVATIVGAIWYRHLPGAMWLAAGSLLYVVGTFGVTVVGNVPLNEALGRLDAESAEGQAYWSHYQRRWTTWNHLRTAAGIAATLVVILGLCGQTSPV